MFAGIGAGKAIFIQSLSMCETSSGSAHVLRIDALLFHKLSSLFLSFLFFSSQGGSHLLVEYDICYHGIPRSRKRDQKQSFKVKWSLSLSRKIYVIERCGISWSRDAPSQSGELRSLEP